MNQIINTRTQYSDEEIIQQLLLGNIGQFEILIRRYNPALYKTGRAYGFNHHDTEDLMQEAYITAYQNLAKFEGRSVFKTWLIRIMLNLCYHKARKKSYQNEKATDLWIKEESETMNIFSNHSHLQPSLLSKELVRIIESSINQLPNDYKLTFALRELTGLTVAETAELMHTTPANVKVRLSRAKTMLRKEIEKMYSPADIFELNLVYCSKIVDTVMSRMQKTDMP